MFDTLRVKPNDANINASNDEANKIETQHDNLIDKASHVPLDDQIPKLEAINLIQNHDNRIQPSTTVFVAAFGAVLGALSMGLALGYTSPAFLDIENSSETNAILSPDIVEREQEKSLIGSTMAIGALIASLASEPINTLFGRRIPLILCGIPFVIGWLLLAFADGVTKLVIGRFFIGAACGIACSIAPTYVVEISPPQIRGALGTSFQLMVVLGNLVESILGMFLSWRSLALWSLLPAIGMSLTMIFMPESPNWLLNKGRNNFARMALKRFRANEIDEEFRGMLKATAEQGSTQGYSLELLKSGEFCRPLLYALGLFTFSQFTGINAVLMYQGDIFKKASPDSNALMSTVWVCLAQVIATVVCSFLIDRLGRKILLWISGAGDMLTLIVFGLYSYLADGNKTFQQDYAIVPLISLISFIVFFSFGLGPIPWMMVPELSSSRVRSLTASFGACFAWTGAYIVTVSMKPLIQLIGDAWTYWTLASICALSCAFIYILPETKISTKQQDEEETQE